MSGFAIYNYNFLRIIRPNEEYQLEFPDWVKVNVQESFENRQQLLEELLLADFEKPFPFENARKKPYWHKQIVKPQDNVYVMRVANVTNVTITDEHLMSQKYADYRNCLVIIDNRPGIQRIAIERKSTAFSHTKTVANILEASFCKLLKSKLLKVELSAVYSSNVFWDMLKKYPNVITAKPKAHAFKNEMCFPLTKTKCELKKHPNSKFECFFNDFNRTKTSLILPFPSKLFQDNLVCVLALQE